MTGIGMSCSRAHSMTDLTSPVSSTNVESSLVVLDGVPRVGEPRAWPWWRGHGRPAGGRSRGLRVVKAVGDLFHTAVSDQVEGGGFTEFGHGRTKCLQIADPGVQVLQLPEKHLLNVLAGRMPCIPDLKIVRIWERESPAARPRRIKPSSSTASCGYSR